MPKTLTKAQKRIRFIENLCLVGDSWGKPFRLLDWQKDFIERAYADKPVIREAYLQLPRSAGKTDFAAALVLTELICGNGGQEIVSAASTFAQAGKLHEYAEQMISQDPWLKARTKVNYSKLQIHFEPKANKYYSIPAQYRSANSIKPTLVVADELHLWEGLNGRLLWDALHTGSGTRKDRLFVTITTAGFDKTSLCYEQYQRAKKVEADPLLDPSYLPVIYEYTGEDFFDEANWYKANPSLGHHVDIESYRELAKVARLLPTSLNSFRQLYLNAWIDNADRGWIPLGLWDSCEEDFREEDLYGRECFMGLDCASVKDLMSLVAVFNVDGKWKVLHWSWIGEESATTRTREDNVPYGEWIKGGKLRATKGVATSFDQVRDDIIELSTRFRIEKLVMDRAQGAQLSQQLDDAGIDVDIYPQSVMAMSYPCKQIERYLLAGDIAHQGKRDPVLRWAAGNCVVELDRHENYFPSKKKSKERIDPVVAMVMAMGAALNEEPGSQLLMLSMEDQTKDAKYQHGTT